MAQSPTPSLSATAAPCSSAAVRIPRDHLQQILLIAQRLSFRPTRRVVAFAYVGMLGKPISVVPPVQSHLAYRRGCVGGRLHGSVEDGLVDIA